MPFYIVLTEDNFIKQSALESGRRIESCKYVIETTHQATFDNALACAFLYRLAIIRYLPFGARQRKRYRNALARAKAK